VEDEPAVRRLLARALRDRGYDALAAAEGGGALGIAQERSTRIDVLVTDMLLPDIAGGAVALGVRQARPHLPVIYMSGYGGDRIGGGDAPTADAILAKPFTGQELAESITGVLVRRRAPGISPGA
jgi:two-component system cell cycle sensor histidine kinase/response regulator CckA